ncbi:LysR family transcriptional regulator [Terriglobus albidus]|uniref:LysR substrate-binding domain-containing protein n=1 Tax=Terriglobus albidus TaxID=1592106 RepID=UPI0021DF4AEC|nr:LysR family transcriptional regulator [Terriglobus albidus]
MSLYDSLEFKHLRSIVAIAEAGTLTAAAFQLPLAQSALSRQISELEDALGVQLLDRTRGRAILNDEGELLLAFARVKLKERAELIDNLQARQQVSIYPFSLGFTAFVEHDVISEVCSAYRQLFPKATIEPASFDLEELIGLLKERQLDAALVTLPLQDDVLKIQPMMHERLVVCIRADDPLAEKTSLSPADLTGRLRIFSDPRHHPRAHARLLEMLNEKGIEPRISNPTFNGEHIQWMVREGLCFALIRERQHLHKDLTTRPIEGVSWTIDSAIVYHPEQKRKVMSVLIKELEKRFTISPDLQSETESHRQSGPMSSQQGLFGDDDAELKAG